MKRCLSCQEEKPLDAFYTNGVRRGKQSYKSHCKECHLAYRRTGQRPDTYRPRVLVDHDAPSRVCVRCGVEKPKEEFPPRYGKGENPRARRKNCRSCETERNRPFFDRWRKNNREKYNALKRAWKDAHPDYQARYRAEHWQYFRAHAAQCTARKKGVLREFVDYEQVWLESQGLCHFCGLEVDMEDLEFAHVTWFVEGGEHEDENVVVAHKDCNRSRNAHLFGARAS